MTTSYIGSMSVGALSLGVNLAMPSLTARLGELTALQAELQAKVASINARIALIAEVSIPNVTQLTAGLNAALSGVAQIATQFPQASINLSASLQADIAATLALAAAIQVKLDALVELIATLNLSLSGGGIAAYSYQGRADQLGPEVGSALAGGIGGGGAQAISGLVLACSSPGDWAKLGVVLKVE